jgi:hypothetical protein
LSSALRESEKRYHGMVSREGLFLESTSTNFG